jgi:hypothetical protein
MWAVIVVKSADDVLDVTRDIREAFATAIGDLLTREDVTWRLVAPPPSSG